MGWVYHRAKFVLKEIPVSLIWNVTFMFYKKGQKFTYFSFELALAWSSDLDGSVSVSLSWYELKPESTRAHWLQHNVLLYYITKGRDRHCLVINYSIEQMITKIWEETPSAAKSAYDTPETGGKILRNSHALLEKSNQMCNNFIR